MILLGSGSAIPVWWFMYVKIGEEVAKPERGWCTCHHHHTVGLYPTVTIIQAQSTKNVTCCTHSVDQIVTNGDPTWNTLHFKSRPNLHTTTVYSELSFVWWKHIIICVYLVFCSFTPWYLTYTPALQRTINALTINHKLKTSQECHEINIHSPASFPLLWSYSNLFWKIASCVPLLTDDYWVMKLQQETLHGISLDYFTSLWSKRFIFHNREFITAIKVNPSMTKPTIGLLSLKYHTVSI